MTNRETLHLLAKTERLIHGRIPDDGTQGQRAMAAMIKLAETLGFRELPIAEQDYLLDLVIFRAYGKTLDRLPPLSGRPLS